VLFSDYRGGVVSTTLVQAAGTIAREQQKTITVDSQGNLLQFHGFDLVKANQQELEAFCGRILEREKDVQRESSRLLQKLQAKAVLITRAAEGMALVRKSGEYLHLPAVNRTEVFDVTGAGDTVIAVATHALAGGASPEAAVRLANLAASLVIRKLGNVAPTVDELRVLLST
jgi:rfaE bifunctional protein kinase chain/domain